MGKWERVRKRYIWDKNEVTLKTTFHKYIIWGNNMLCFFENSDLKLVVVIELKQMSVAAQQKSTWARTNTF